MVLRLAHTYHNTERVMLIFSLSALGPAVTHCAYGANTVFHRVRPQKLKLLLVTGLLGLYSNSDMTLIRR